MQQLVLENKQLKDMAAAYSQQLQELQQRSKQHENQIQTLLKFNQKLLGIIEKQLHGHKIKTDDMVGLHPISERTETQSEMFHSQLTNMVSATHKSNNLVTNLVSQKRSLNLKPDFIKEKGEPMANIDREEQLSIVVEGEKEREINEESGEVKSLILEFRRPVHTLDGNMTLAQIAHNIADQVQQFETLKESSLNYYSQKIQHLREFQQTINVQPKKQLAALLEKVEGTQEAKDLIKSFLEQI